MHVVHASCGMHGTHLAHPRVCTHKDAATNSCDHTSPCITLSSEPGGFWDHAHLPCHAIMRMTVCVCVKACRTLHTSSALHPASVVARAVCQAVRLVLQASTSGSGLIYCSASAWVRHGRSPVLAPGNGGGRKRQSTPSTTTVNCREARATPCRRSLWTLGDRAA